MSPTNTLRFTLFALILLTLTACNPAQAAPPTQPQPLSTSNPDAFSTMVAEKAAAYMTLTMQAMPTPTATLLPPTATTAPTLTPTPTDTNETTSLAEMEDGSTQFIDYQAGLRLNVPPGWLAVRLSGSEFEAAVTSAETEDPVLGAELEDVRELDPLIYRLHAFNTLEGYVSEWKGSLMDVVFIEGNTQELTLIAEVEVQPKNLENYELVTSEYQVRTDSLELFILEETWQITAPSEAQLTLYHKRVVFKVTNGTVYIDLLVPLEIKDKALEEFDTMIEGLSTYVP